MARRYSEESPVPVEDLREGDLVDVEGDPFAGSYVAAEFEYLEVAGVERETVDCVAVGLEGFDLVGFPVGHQLPTRRYLEAA
jgi:hypothetical protein